MTANFKIMIIGDCKSGKTAMVESYKCVDHYDTKPRSFQHISEPTVGVTSYDTVIGNHGINYSLTILDASGQDRYKDHRKAYYKQVTGVMIVFDVTNRRSFESAISKWPAELFPELLTMDQWACVMLVANKTDIGAAQSSVLSANRSDLSKHEDAFSLMEICAKEQYNGARHTGISLMARVSAKTGDLMDESFSILLKKMHEKRFERQQLQHLSLQGFDMREPKDESCTDGSSCHTFLIPRKPPLNNNSLTTPSNHSSHGSCFSLSCTSEIGEDEVEENSSREEKTFLFLQDRESRREGNAVRRQRAKTIAKSERKKKKRVPSDDLCLVS